MALTRQSINPQGQVTTSISVKPGMSDNSTLQVSIKNLTGAAISNIVLMPGAYPLPAKIATVTIAEHMRNMYGFPAGSKVDSGDVDYSAYAQITGSFADIPEYTKHMREDVLSINGIKITTDNIANYDGRLVIRDYRNPKGKPYGQNEIYMDALKTPVGSTYSNQLFMPDLKMYKDKYIVVLLSSLAANSTMTFYINVDGIADTYDVRPLTNTSIG